MKLSELVKLVATSDNPDPDLYVAERYMDEEGNIEDIKYFEIEVEKWEDRDPTSHFIIQQGDLVSG